MNNDISDMWWATSPNSEDKAQKTEAAHALTRSTGYAWIAVEDEIPRHGQRVLVAADGEVKEAECWRGNTGKGKRPIWDAPYYGQELSHTFEGVTHWMPMPSLPA